MARAERQGAARLNHYRRTESRRVYPYIDGNAVRKAQPLPEKRQTRKTPSTSLATRKNRERALQMNLGYVIFLTAAAVATVFMCVTYLQLQAKSTMLNKEVTSLEAQLDAVILENDADYNGIMTGIDMAHVKDVAMNELGMDYASKDQIVTYEESGSDYVRQYTDIPAE